MGSQECTIKHTKILTNGQPITHNNNRKFISIWIQQLSYVLVSPSLQLAMVQKFPSLFRILCLLKEKFYNKVCRLIV